MIQGIGAAAYSTLSFIFTNMEMAGALLFTLIVRWHDIIAARSGGNEDYKTRTRFRRSIRADRNRIWVHSDRMKVLGARRDGKSYPQGHLKASGPRKES